IPMLEPSDSMEAKEFTKLAFELSEKYDTPVFVRTTTRLAHSQSCVLEGERVEPAVKPYVKDITKYTMMPSSAIGRHVKVEERENRLKADVETMNINREELNDLNLGVVCSGVVYQYVKDALPDASVFKIGTVYPMPIEAIRAFSKKVKRLVVIEELEPFFENQLKANGIVCEGKSIFSKLGEISVYDIKEKMLGEAKELVKNDLPIRPPVMCAGCPHRGVFYVLKKLGLTVSADIGCYTLGAGAPLSAVDTVVCMGASIGIAHGFKKALGEDAAKKVVSVIGDSTFIHSGITGLINAVYNGSNLTLIILDNSTTGMTGHQNHPATGLTLKGTPSPILNLVDVCKVVGAKSVSVVDAYDMAAVETAVKNAIDEEGVSVVVAKRPCALLNKNYPPSMNIDGCKKCGACLKIGCPAIEKQKDGTARINSSLCVGCGLCAKLCKFDAIKGGKQ
ncbi:MAG: thiamine pyrophosphate-dependent enzyme, partial [Firmicutes bacterium]|nr:thiamine pyrophosphate-dependent enzyme [Bacillota bacterium]